MSVNSRRAEYAELTKLAVLGAAAERFAADGFAATTIDDIAELARVSKGAVYYHFAAKATLFEAVFRERQLALIDTVLAAAAPREDPWEQLRAGLGAFLDGCVADPVHRALLQQAPAALGAARCHEIDHEIGLPVLAAALRNLADRGELADHRIDLLARILFSALCEAAMAAGADDDPSTARDDAETILQTLTLSLRATG